MSAGLPCRFVHVVAKAWASEDVVPVAAIDLEAGLYGIRRDDALGGRDTFPVTLESGRPGDGHPEIRIEPGLSVLRGVGLDPVAFALSVLRSPRIPPDLLADMKAVMAAVGRAVGRAHPGPRKVSIWVDAPLGGLPASNRVGNGLFEPDPPLDPTLLRLPSVAVVEVEEARQESDGDDWIPARIRIGTLHVRTSSSTQRDDPMDVLRRLARLGDLAGADEGTSA